MAGALCFYLTKAHANEWMRSSFSDNDEEEFSDLAKIVLKATASEITKEKLMDWFETHKIRVEE